MDLLQAVGIHTFDLKEIREIKLQ
jgi:hypothetical protein